MAKEYHKVCPECKRAFITSARNRKFCEVDHEGKPSVCGEKSLKRRKKNRREYRKNAEAMKIKSASHRLAVAVLMETSEKVCAVSGSKENLEAHHKNLEYLDNRPINLCWLRKDIHSKIHSYIEKRYKELTDMGERVNSVTRMKFSNEFIKKESSVE